MKLVAVIIVVLFGLGLMGFAAFVMFRRASAERFLHSFASSARAHYVEQILRLAVGTAMVIASPAMWHSTLFEIFGWTIVVTAAVLILLPWRWHRAFGTWAIPMAIRHIKLYAAAALILGGVILYAASRFALV